MSYHISKTVAGEFSGVRGQVIEALKSEDFGVLTEIDVAATFKKKLNVDFRPYVILGACNPKLAYQSLQAESRIGVMLPCNVILQDAGDGRTEVSAVDPVASMQAIENPDLAGLASEVRGKLQHVIDSL